MFLSPSVSSLLKKSRSFSSMVPSVKRIPELVKADGEKTFPVDTLPVVKKLTEQGFTTGQAEVIVSFYEDCINENHQLQMELQAFKVATKNKHSQLKQTVDKQSANLASVRTVGEKIVELKLGIYGEKFDKEIAKISAGNSSTIKELQGFERKLAIYGVGIPLLILAAGIGILPFYSM